ncbi:MAG: hypothetical protein LUE99_00325 [Bacteroides sp.]|nr:hypothetical protein [Bacteroides sp.]
MRKYFALLFLLLLSMTAQSQDIYGSWFGELNAGMNKINLVFNISKNDKGEDVCTMDSPDQGAKGLPATITRLSATSVKISMPAIGAAYEGNIDGEQITGKFSQSGYTFDLILKPGKIVRKRPQTPQPLLNILPRKSVSPT